jgi:hypothetical protein
MLILLEGGTDNLNMLHWVCRELRDSRRKDQVEVMSFDFHGSRNTLTGILLTMGILMMCFTH